MAMFKSDAQGFLVGEVVKSNHDMLKAQQQGLMIWRAIRADVKEIARAVGVQNATAARLTQPSARGPRGLYGTRSVVAPAGRSIGGDRGRMQAPAARVTSPGGRNSTSVVASPMQRSANGRFVAGQKRGGSNAAPGVDTPASPGSGGAMSRLSDTIGRLSASMNAADNMDPTINAAKEITDVVGPLGRGLFSMFGRNAERKKERWYNRILKALTNPIGGKAGPAGASGAGAGLFGGALGGIGASLKFIPIMLMGLFTRILMPIAALWASFEVGQWVGKKIYEWLDSAGIITKIFDAFDSIKETATGAWSAVTNGIQGAWKTATDAFTSAIASFMSFPEKIGNLLSGIDSALRNIPIIGKAYAKASDLAQGAATQVRAGYDDARGNRNEAAPAVGVVQTAARGSGVAVGQGVNVITGGTAAKRGFQTGAEYSQGNIGGLDDARTRALVASTAMTESGGGNLGVVNSGGYMGRYQAGAGWLADAGLISGGSAATRAAMKADGYSSESKWGASGGMTKFLKNDKNWNDGMTYEKYLSSAATQDAAFKTISDSAYTSMMKNGTIGAGTPQEQIAGLLKARHIAGMGGAMAVARGGTGASDSNGTSARKYYEDMAADKNGLYAAYRHSLVTPATPNIPSIAQSAVPSAAPATIPPLPDLPALPTRLNNSSSSGRGSVSINLPEQTGQNVSDRSIAHIVTGGMGSK